MSYFTYCYVTSKPKEKNMPYINTDTEEEIKPFALEIGTELVDKACNFGRLHYTISEILTVRDGDGNAETLYRLDKYRAFKSAAEIYEKYTCVTGRLGKRKAG